MFDVPYSTATERIPDTLAPDNSISNNPLEFDLVPAWGPDLARLKSVMTASLGLVNDGNWSPELQAAVIAGFETGAPAFVNTVTTIRGLTIPAAMALRGGILPALPPGMKLDGRIPVTTGAEFSRICGAPEFTGIALHVAFKIVGLTGKQQVDARFFVQPSGSGGAGTSGPTATTVRNARRTSKKPGTAAAQ